MQVEAAIRSIESLDYSVVQRAKDVPETVAEAIVDRRKSWPAGVRELAVNFLAAQNTRQGAMVLVRMTGDPSLQVASAAARALDGQTSLPPGDLILEQIPSRPDPFLRSKLFYAAGKAQCGLEPVRALRRQEANPRVAAVALAVAVRRGGEPEWKEFFQSVRKAEPDQVIEFEAKLLYIGDKRLAKALLDWLVREDDVTREGSDRQPTMLRMCDFAVWIAYQLGTGVRITPEHITAFAPAVIAAARPVLQALPDLE